MSTGCCCKIFRRWGRSRYATARCTHAVVPAAHDRALVETTEIEEIQKYVHELAGQLRAAGHTNVAESLLAITERFKNPTEVRQAVYSLDQAVRRWLSNPQGMPTDASTQLTAQFLVDACKNALSQGAIRSLAPTPRESAKQLGRLAAVTFTLGVLLVLLPAVLLVIGFDWVAWLMPDQVMGNVVARGEEIAVPVNLSMPAPKYDGAMRVEIEPSGDCKGPEWDELSCEPAERLWGDGVRHRTLHVVRPAEVSGILIAVGSASLQGAHGRGTLRVFAPDDAAEGDYLIPLEGAYLPDPELCDEVTLDAGVSDAAGAAGASRCVAPAVANALLPLLRSPISAVRIQVR